MSKRGSALYLQDILSSITAIEDYTKGLTFKEFSQDRKTIDAVVRNFETRRSTRCKRTNRGFTRV